MEEIIIGNDKFEVRITQYGAELQQLTRLKDEKDYIWSPVEQFWNRRAPNLFPVVGRLKHDKYLHKGNYYELGQHGFARNSLFKIIKYQPNEVTLELESNNKTSAVYPFKFQLLIHFIIVENVLTVSAEIHNTGSEILPFSYGAHPAFALESPMRNYSLRISGKDKILRRFLNEGIRIDQYGTISLDNHTLILEDELFKDDAIVLENQSIEKVDILENGKPYISVASIDNPYYGIWTKPGAPFLCLEPWWGIADSINSTGEIMEKEGVTKLEVNGKISHTYSIEMH
jgi:galactose mutarotase-like enzyme